MECPHLALARWSLFRLMVSPMSLHMFACLVEYVHRTLELLFSVLSDSIIISEEHIPNKGLMHLGLITQS